MDAIYANAHLTLIAAAGADSTYGLPGVSRPRISQPSLCNRQMTMFPAAPNAHSIIHESYWNTRAWTYQEAVLSRRVLIFTDHHVIFQCGPKLCTETIQSPAFDDDPDRIYPPERLPFDFDPQDPDGWNSWTHLKRTTQQIAQYSVKNLTYASDRLNACLGLLNNKEAAYPEIYHVWGVPVSFIGGAWNLMLAWSSTEPRTRQAAFPSWSWAGWSGSAPVSYATESWPGKTYPYALEPQYHVWLAADDGRDPAHLIPLEYFVKWHNDLYGWSVGSRYIKIQGFLRSVTLEVPTRRRRGSGERPPTAKDVHVVIPGPRLDKLVPLAVDDADFDLSTLERRPFFALQVTAASPDPYLDTPWFVVVSRKPDSDDATYERIGLFKLTSVQDDDGEYRAYREPGDTLLWDVCSKYREENSFVRAAGPGGDRDIVEVPRDNRGNKLCGKPGARLPLYAEEESTVKAWMSSLEKAEIWLG